MRPAATGRNEEAIGGEISPARIAVSWGVHLFTASGAVIGAVALVEIGSGNLPRAALLMLAAFVIDALDGTLARAAGVAQALPQVDGRRLDDMVDFLNYVVVPAVFMLAAGTLPHWGFAALPVLASCYGFSQVAAKTEDDFFLGFPSYWNIVAIYAWGLGTSPAMGAVIVGFLSLMVFVPIKYAYPSKLTVLRTPTAVLGFLWTLTLAICVLAPDHVRAFHLLELTLAYPVYYLAISLWLGGLHRETA
jgi:phosphatidylcholine synthase